MYFVAYEKVESKYTNKQSKRTPLTTQTKIKMTENLVVPFKLFLVVLIRGKV